MTGHRLLHINGLHHLVWVGVSLWQRALSDSSAPQGQRHAGRRVRAPSLALGELVTRVLSEKQRELQSWGEVTDEGEQHE